MTRLSLRPRWPRIRLGHWPSWPLYAGLLVHNNIVDTIVANLVDIDWIVSSSAMLTDTDVHLVWNHFRAQGTLKQIFPQSYKIPFYLRSLYTFSINTICMYSTTVCTISHCTYRPLKVFMLFIIKNVRVSHKK